MYLDSAKFLIQELNPKLARLFVGCTKAEIETLENSLPLPLPAAFREFLLWFGKSGGNIMRGSFYYYAAIVGQGNYAPLNEDAEELLNENGLNGKEILKNALVFMDHQGYMIEFIRLDEGPNPPVYFFQESSKPTENVVRVWAKSFSDYIENLLSTYGKPGDSLLIYDESDLANPFSYDDKIRSLSFNGSFKSNDGRLPARILDFTGLESLDLRYFGLTELPETLGNLSQLKLLNLNHNALRALPTCLAQLPQLEKLYLSGNPLDQEVILQLRRKRPDLDIHF